MHLCGREFASKSGGKTTYFPLDTLIPMFDISEEQREKHWDDCEPFDSPRVLDHDPTWSVAALHFSAEGYDLFGALLAKHLQETQLLEGLAVESKQQPPANA